MDIKQVRVCADLNVFSYYDQSEATEQRIKELGFDKVRYFDTNGAQAFIAHNKKEIYVIYRGTEVAVKMDWIRNFSVWPRYGEEQGKVHSGFADATDQIWKEISYYLDATVMTHRGMSLNVYFTGHSQGAAMSVISAARSKYVAQVCTFGMPRMCNRKFTRNIKSQITRFNFENDIIPRVVPGGFYKHCGTGYDMIGNEIYQIKNVAHASKLWLKMAVIKLIKLQFFRSLLTDHNIKLYALAARYNQPNNY